VAAPGAGDSSACGNQSDAGALDRDGHAGRDGKSAAQSLDAIELIRPYRAQEPHLIGLVARVHRLRITAGSLNYLGGCIEVRWRLVPTQMHG